MTTNIKGKSVWWISNENIFIYYHISLFNKWAFFFFFESDDDKLKDAIKLFEKANRAFTLKGIYSGCRYIREAADNVYDIDLDKRHSEYGSYGRDFNRRLKNQIETLANNTQLICKGY